METVHILNPAAGQGGALKFSDNENVYITKSKGDAKRYVLDYVTKNGAANFIVYGGDGTLNEVVDGILSSGVRGCTLSAVPTDTGNDLVRTVKETADAYVDADILKVGDGYSVNAVNTGFDLDVVLWAAEYKKRPFISGSLAYVLGIVTTLFRAYGKYMKITYTDADGNEGGYEGDCLLCVASNGRYYGGGFKCSPIADITDGLIDLLIVKKVSRLKFISLVGLYQKGKHIDKQTGAPIEKFKNCVVFSKCKQVTIEGIDSLCLDGEVTDATYADISVIPRALRVEKTK